MGPAASLEDPHRTKEKLIVALDVPSAAEALSIFDELKGNVGAFKVGLQLFTSSGPDLVRKLTDAGAKVFLDLKFHDIPNTVAKASVEAARLGVWMFNVHAAGGGEMMRRTLAEVSEDCDKRGASRPLVIAVTVLTSSNDATLAETGIAGETEPQVLRLAELTAKCGLDGVVASSHEVEPIRRSAASNNLLIVTPGIRPSSATNDDQKRVMTPGAALAAGSDHLVIGRPITAAADRVKAVEQIIREIDSGDTL